MRDEKEEIKKHVHVYIYMYSAQYEERELVTISVFSHFLGH